MIRSIDFKLGHARGGVGTVTDRVLPPYGTVMPRPFDVRHIWKAPAGRSTGGYYYLTKHESMEWIYTVGVSQLYTTLFAFYNPRNPWVWVQIYDVITDNPAWFEACMQEPRLSRSGANVITNLVVPFIHVVRYP